MKRVEAVLEQVRGPTVIDLGAVQHDAENADSDGWLHGRLTEHFETVIGVDILSDEVAELNGQGYDIRLANVETMALDVRANTVVAGELIEHVANPGKMLDRVRDHLVPNGRLVLTTPNPWALVHLKRWAFNMPQINAQHVAWYGPVVLRQLLNRHGFRVFVMRPIREPQSGIVNAAMRVAGAFGLDAFTGQTWLCVAELADQ